MISALFIVAITMVAIFLPACFVLLFRILGRLEDILEELQHSCEVNNEALGELLTSQVRLRSSIVASITGRKAC